VRDGQVRAARPGAKHGARIVAAGHSYRAFRHRRRHSQRRAYGSGRPAGFDARSRRHCPELLERAATAAQRLDLGTGIAAMGGEVLSTTVIPGRIEDANPESRDSGFDASHRPGMTKGENMTTEITIDTGTNELLCAIRVRVAIITLNRPEVRNALSDNLTPALRTMIKTCGENPEVGALLITGAGTAFCAGGNVKGMGANRDQKKLDMSYDEKVADLQDRQRLLTGALISVRKPTIAALPGPAVGAGLAIAMACDIRIAATSAFISTGY